MGVLAGTEIYEHKSTEKAKEATIYSLNTGNLNGIVMTDRVSGCGHNLTEANIIIFLDSLYSCLYK